VTALRRGHGWILGPALGLALIAGLGSPHALAQIPRPESPFERPSEVRPEIPEPGPAQRPQFTLPPLALPESPSLSAGPRITVHEFRVTGSTVFSREELSRLTDPYSGRPLGSEELEQLRQRLTRLYVDAGYMNSGAVLPDQDVREGVIEYSIVEGRLSEVRVEGNRWFRDAYLQTRILRGAHTPLRLADLEQELQLLQQDPRIRRVDAELLPGQRPGEARLRAGIEEEVPFAASLELSNHDSPSVGNRRAQLDLAHRNLSGWGDTLHAMLVGNQGLWDAEVGYEIPVTRWDTTLGGWFRQGSSDVIEDSFEALGIASEARTIGVELRQPVYRTLSNELELALVAEMRESESFLNGDERFPFEEGTEDGRVELSVVRARVDWVHRDLDQVLALRFQLSAGLDVLGATQDDCAYDTNGVCTTENRDEIPDARFAAWLGQFQWVRRFDRFLGSQLVFRTDLQLAFDPLFSLEQFALGGHLTVRGYRENQLVRDNGLASSLELRIPLWGDARTALELQLVPFADIGRSWNTERPEPGLRTLASLGVGIRASRTERLHLEIYWAEGLQDVDEPEDHDIQDDGVHFAIVASF
jgi:hemolysin activation/secretion protein